MPPLVASPSTEHPSQSSPGAKTGSMPWWLTLRLPAVSPSRSRLTSPIAHRPTQAVAAVLDRFGRLDILVNNAGLMLLGTVLDQNVEEWERMIAINQNGLLYMTNAALPHLLAAAEDGLRGVADIVNISSIAGRRAWPKFAAYNMTKFGVNGFTEALRQEVTQKHVRVGVLEPGAVATELVSHNNDAIKDELAASDSENIPEPLQPEDIAENIAFMVTRPRRSSIAELWAMPTSQA